MMQATHILSGTTYETVIFDGDNFPSIKTITKRSHEIDAKYNCDVVAYTAQLDSPSGQAVSTLIEIGTYLVTNSVGATTACHADLIARDYRITA
jgi:hypothetical protein